MTDDQMALEAIYYSACIPRNSHVLTMLGVVFDKVHFPGVYMPRGDYDDLELEKEIQRLGALDRKNPDTYDLIAMLRFIPIAKAVREFCVFEDEPFGGHGEPPADLVKQIYEAIHGPPRENFEPFFDTNHSKMLPGGEESILFPGDYHYLGGALLKSATTGIPLVNDVKGLPMPGTGGAMSKDDVGLLSPLLAIKCAKLVLPEVSAMTPAQLIDFREQNRENLKAFRAGMLKYAGILAGMIGEGDTEAIEQRTEFFVDTEIRPALEELREDLKKSNRPWSVRAADAAAIGGYLTAAYATGGVWNAAAQGIAKIFDTVSKEAQAARDANERRSRSGLCYLLEIERFVK